MKKYLIMFLAVCMVLGSSMTVFAYHEDFSVETTYEGAYVFAGSYIDRSQYPYVTCVYLPSDGNVYYNKTYYYFFTDEKPFVKQASDGEYHLHFIGSSDDIFAVHVTPTVNNGQIIGYAYKKNDYSPNNTLWGRTTSNLEPYCYFNTQLDIVATNYDVRACTGYAFDNAESLNTLNYDLDTFFLRTMYSTPTEQQVAELVKVVPQMAQQTEITVNNYLAEVMPIIVVSGIGFLVLLIGLPILVRGLRTFLH